MEIKTNDKLFKALLLSIAIGVWVIVFQNAAIISSKQEVYVTGGNIDANINGEVDIKGTVSVGNTVDVNIHEINGHNQVTTGRGKHSVFPYSYMLPVDNW